ncbi:MAG: protein rep [candidate division Zixibacteria bacterium]|nr:protein rep [candidate division Zixibacteria bacterium]
MIEAYSNLNLEKRELDQSSVKPQRPDPRSRYFTQEEIQVRDKILPLLQGGNLIKEASRFSECGVGYIVLKCENEEHHHTVRFGLSFHCELRICTRCSRKRASQVRKEIGVILKHVPKTKTHKFCLLTLTQNMSKDQLLTPESLRQFNKNFRTLINHFYLKKKQCGAIATLEIGKGFNIHAHILVYGPYIPQKAISEKWLEITGDSYIVDIRMVRDQNVVVSYLTKYISKPPSFAEPNDYILYLKAIKRIRRLHRFGILYGFKVETRKPLLCPYCGGRLRYEGITSLFINDRFCQDYWEALNSIKVSMN